MELFWGFYSVPTPFFQEKRSRKYICDVLVPYRRGIMLCSWQVQQDFEVVDELYIYYKIGMYSETC
jgi:hypothetical protein